MKKLVLLLFLLASYGVASAGAPIGSPTGRTSVSSGSGVLTQSDCSAITTGLCLDSDNGYLYAWDGAAVQEIARPQSVVSFPDPNMDKGHFWDDSEGSPGLFSAGTGLEFSTTNLQVTTAYQAKVNRYHQTAHIDPDAQYTSHAGVLVLDPKTAAAITVTEIAVYLNEDPTQELTVTLNHKAAAIGYAGGTQIDANDTVAGTFTASSAFDDATIPAGSKVWLVIGDNPDVTTTGMEVSLTGTYD